MHASIAKAVGGADLSERAASRAAQARVAEKNKFGVGDVGAQLTISIASRIISVRTCVVHRQPTVIRENTSIMKHTAQ